MKKKVAKRPRSAAWKGGKAKKKNETENKKKVDGVLREDPGFGWNLRYPRTAARNTARLCGLFIVCFRFMCLFAGSCIHLRIRRSCIEIHGGIFGRGTKNGLSDILFVSLSLGCVECTHAFKRTLTRMPLCLWVDAFAMQIPAVMGPYPNFSANRCWGLGASGTESYRIPASITL